MFRLIYVKASFFFFFSSKGKREATEFEIPQHDRTIHLGKERACRSLGETYQIFLRPLFLRRKLLSMRRRQKPGEKDGGAKKKKKDGEGEGGSDMHRCVYRPFQIGRLGWRWYLEKKHEMIDDRPILVATYGVPYPPGCSYNGHCSNLFPPSWRCHVPDVIWEQIST